MAIGVLTLQIQLPGCRSLKEKRTRIKPLVTRLHREFNVSVAEMEQQDKWDEATIGCAILSNDSQFTESALRSVEQWLARNWPDITLIDDHIEIIS